MYRQRHRGFLNLPFLFLALCAVLLSAKSSRAAPRPSSNLASGDVSGPVVAVAAADPAALAAEKYAHGHRVSKRGAMTYTIAARQALGPSPNTPTLTSSSITSLSPTTTVASSSSSSPAATTGLPTQVPLVIPDVGADGAVESVRYYGPGQSGSTVYQVLYTNHASETNTATLVEDSVGAALLGVSRTIELNGAPTTVKAAASCGFDSGFNQRGYCDDLQYVGSVTQTYFSSGTLITVATRISPTSGLVTAARSSAYAATAQPGVSDSEYAVYSSSSTSAAVRSLTLPGCCWASAWLVSVLVSALVVTL